MKFSIVGSSIENSALPFPSNRNQIMPGRFLLFRSRVLATLIAVLALFQIGQAHAAVYTLPGSLPAGCTATSSILYTCSSLSLNWADSIKVTNANTRLTIKGALDFGGGNDINFSIPASGFVIQANTVSGTNFVRVKGDIIATSTLTLSSNTNSITGNISAGGDTSLGGSITGAVTTTGGAVNLASGTSVTGNVTSTGGAVTINPSGVTVGGDVTASGAVSLASGTSVTGNVTSTGGDVTLASSNVGVGMCIKAPSSKAINLGWNASAGGVCCSNGSVCSNTCVANNSGNAMPGLCTVTTLIAQYRMEEAAWAGTTGELKDSAGYTGGPFNGQAIGSPFATPASANPARASNPGTCGYATMSGGAFDIPNLPVVTTPGAKTSVAFWMYWDGTNSVMPMGWKQHDLWLVGGFFGFNTGNSDVYGISSSALKNGWHHVVAIFTNGSVTTNKLYIDGVDQSLSQRLSSPSNSFAVVSPTLRIGGWMRDSGYRFKSAIDELAVFNGALSASEVTALFAQTHACSFNNAAAANFECMDGYLTESAYVNRQTNPSGRNPVYTKLAGTPFKLLLVPLAGDGSVKTDYFTAGGSSKNVTVELFDNSSTPAPACSAYSAGNLVATQSATLASGGAYLTGNFTVNKAYPTVMCRVTDSNGASPVYGCGSDQFAVRPGVVTLNTTASAAAPSASASPAIKAGSSFNLVAATSTNATDVYSGALTQDVTLLTAQNTAQDTTAASGGVVGALTPVSLTANATPSGIAAYTEAGYLYLAAGAYRDATYTAVDQVGDCVSGSTSVTLSGGKYGCVIGTTASVSLGRFVPDHFSITPGSVSASCVTHPAASGSYSPTDFTYFSQPDGFGTPFTLTALNGASTPVPTKNYAGVFAKINNPVWSWTNTSNVTGLRFGTSSPLPAGAILSAATVAGVAVVPSGNWVNGAVALASVKHQISRPSALTGETLVTVTALPVDADGVTMSAAVAVSNSSTALRYGRIRLQNAYGSERLALPVPLKLEYYSVAPQGWLPNTDDACTSIAAGNFSFAFPSGTSVKPNNLAACETALTVSGTSPNLILGLSAPGSTNAGWTDLTLNLGSSVLGATSACTAVGGAGGPDVPATMPWLQSRSGTNPTARATFGIYKSPIIYRRENY